ncbi:MAG: hypothetical protein LPK46_08060 [Bacteroidota bacterium]|nr:hypothetical protein [Bacteroidota bacterium]MDX5428296.1 hypothetical protein [Bacteroidota bacterium]MDX5447216.1 hypothetical protein [Bacteroidota bacterium]MDX5506078.1 hypothetical protein [Bacteroidota bacterium]
MGKNGRYIITSIIIFGALTRLIPHPWHVTATGAIALLGGALFKDKKWALMMPIISLFVSDLILNNLIYSSFSGSFGLFYPGMTFVYSAFLLTVVLGMRIKKANYGSLFLGSIGSALLFFVITNFGSWVSMPHLYTRDLSGLMAAYAAGVPFFGNTLLGNIVFSLTLFGLYQVLVFRMRPQEAR